MEKFDVCSSFFSQLTVSRKMTVDAESKANWSLLRCAFKGWKDDAMASRIEVQIDHRAVSGAFGFWVIRQRGRLLQRVRDQRFLQEAFEIWKERYEGIHDALESTSEILEHSRAVKLLNGSFQVWRQRLRFCDEQVHLAEVIA
jgi:Sfi1 spindle body protein